MSAQIRNLSIGIDPGFKGAIAIYDIDQKEVVKLVDMPTSVSRTGKNELDRRALLTLCEEFGPKTKVVVMEDVHAMTYVNARGEVRGQGAASSFAFGKSTGILIGMLTMTKAELLFTKPAVWKALYGLSSDKNKSIELAKAKFPSQINSLTRKKDDGRAEALLLALLAAERLAPMIKSA